MCIIFVLSTVEIPLKNIKVRNLPFEFVLSDKVNERIIRRRTSDGFEKFLLLFR
jgi:hypothetical protein